VQPALARRSPAIGNAIALFDHVVDGIYWLLTSRAGLAEDAESEAHTQALTGLLSKLNQAAANPIVGAAIATAVAQLPAASQDAIKAVQADMPVFLQAIQTATIQAPSAPGAPVKAVPAAPGAPSSTTAPPAP
jgi:hypothetical protein